MDDLESLSQLSLREPLPEPVHPPNCLHESSQTIILNTWLFSQKKKKKVHRIKYKFLGLGGEALSAGHWLSFYHGCHRYFYSLMNNTSSISTLKLALYASENAIIIWSTYPNNLLSSTSCHWTNLLAPEEFILCTIHLPNSFHLFITQLYSMCPEGISCFIYHSL